MAQCELCGTEVRALFFGNPNEVVLCQNCIAESRKIDGTLSSAFEKIRKKRELNQS